MIYRSTSILFQMLFEYRFITRLPREDFLPAQTEYNFTKGSKLGRVSVVYYFEIYKSSNIVLIF